MHIECIWGAEAVGVAIKFPPSSPVEFRYRINDEHTMSGTLTGYSWLTLTADAVWIVGTSAMMTHTV